MNTDSTRSRNSINTLSEINNNETSLAAKLRRLKIQESILLQNVLKCSSIDQQDEDIRKFIDLTGFKTFLVKKKHDLAEIKRMFYDVKTCVHSQETLKNVDMDEIKRNIIELDIYMKKIKTMLQTELIELKSSENRLNVELSQSPQEITNAKKSKCKVSKSKYNEIVPSRVKLLMDSPFKCVEVQEFQEFMKSSHNRYGGWNEFNHNIFVKSWHSYFCPEKEHLNCDDFQYIASDLEDFVEDISTELHDVSKEDIKVHIEWYVKYLQLKKRQKNAVHKWRSNREIMKKRTKVSNHMKNNKEEEIVLDAIKRENKTGIIIFDGIRKSHMKVSTKTSSSNSLCKNTDRDLVEATSEEGPQFLRPTKQGSYRLTGTDLPTNFKNYMNLESIKKLGTPAWKASVC